MENMMPLPATTSRVLLGALLTWLAAAGPTFANERLMLGNTNGRDFDTPYIAEGAGIFARHGIDVTITRFPSVTGVVAALVSGSNDIAPASIPVMLQAVDSDIDLVALCGVARISAKSPSAGLVVRRDRGITQPADLVGKRIAINSLNSIWDLLLRRWLQIKHVPPDQITFVEVALPLMRDTLRGGSIDAIATIEPFLTAALTDRANVEIAPFALEVDPDLNSGNWIAMRGWATAHREMAKQFCASIDEADQLIREQPDKARALLAPQYKGAAITFADEQIRLSPKDFTFFYDLMKSAGQIDHPIDVTGLVFVP